MLRKRSLLNRITGADRSFDDDATDRTFPEISQPQTDSRERDTYHYETRSSEQNMSPISEPHMTEVSIDLFETNDSIIVKTFIAGVRPENVDLSLSRDRIVVSGSRNDEHSVNHDQYYYQELSWGEFSRTIQLPEEVDIDNAKADFGNGLLTVILPKLDRARETKLKVKAKIGTQ